MNLEAPGGHLVSSLTCTALQGSQRCPCDSTGTAWQASISWKAPCCVLCLLLGTSLAGPGVLQGCYGSGDALTCGISSDTGTLKQFLYPEQFRKGWRPTFSLQEDKRHIWWTEASASHSGAHAIYDQCWWHAATTPLLPKAGIQSQGIFQASAYSALWLAWG